MKRSISSSTVSSKVQIIEDKYGKAGIPIAIKTNHFKIEQHDDFKLTQYRVDFEPEVTITNTKKKIIYENKEKLNLKRNIFDGNNLYLSKSFESLILDTTFMDRPMKIIIRRTNTVKSTDPMAFQIFNLILRDSMSALKLQNIRRNFFDPAAKKEIKNANLEILPGYLSSIRPYENDNILMCSEVIHKFLRKETIYNICRDLMKNERTKDTWKDILKKEIIGSVVLTEYTNKTYQVDDIDYSMSANSTFKMANGETSTYVDYYQQKYGIKIDDPRQFMLVSKSRERDIRAGQPEYIYLIPELCQATGMTDRMRQDFRLMQEISAYTRLNPQKRIEALESFNHRLQTTPESMKILNEWDMKLDKELMEIEARELPKESIVFGGDQTVVTNEKAEWSIRGSTSMYKTVECVRWIFLYPEDMENESLKFLAALIEAGKAMNYTIAKPLHKSIQDDRQQTYVREIDAIAQKKPRFILIALPTNRADRYSSVKQKAMVEYGIPCQVIVKNRVMNNKNLHSICTKVAIQINAKLGGLPWTIKLPIKGLMTIGFDISHNKSKSIGALVATMDLNVSEEFYSVTMEYKDGNEMVKELDKYVQIAIKKYSAACGSYPERIVFYRDGVGEGQLEYIMNQEVIPMQQMLTKFYDNEPKFAYVLVNKRTNARFFKPMGNGYINPRPGTIIDQDVTSYDRKDFFLIAQSVGQGTVAPTHYTILVNTTGLSTDRIQMLTYKMCHLYFNWSGTVRIPAVSQYAKKLAFLTGQSIHKPVHEDLRNTLYFL